MTGEIGRKYLILLINALFFCCVAIFYNAKRHSALQIFLRRKGAHV